MACGAAVPPAQKNNRLWPARPLAGPALDAVARTGGSWLAVTDDDLRAAIATLARTGGILAEPAGAAALAGVIADRATLGADHLTVVALVSGTGLKDQRWLPSDGGREVPIAPSLDAVERALAAS